MWIWNGWLETKDFGGAPIVRLQPVYPGFRIALRELKDILEVCAPEGVDALGVVSDDRHIPVDEAHEIDYLRLYSVCVLILIDQNVGEDRGVELFAAPRLPRAACARSREGHRSPSRWRPVFFSA